MRICFPWVIRTYPAHAFAGPRDSVDVHFMTSTTEDLVSTLIQILARGPILSSSFNIVVLDRSNRGKFTTAAGCPSMRLCRPQNQSAMEKAFLVESGHGEFDFRREHTGQGLFPPTDSGLFRKLRQRQQSRHASQGESGR